MMPLDLIFQHGVGALDVGFSIGLHRAGQNGVAGFGIELETLGGVSQTVGVFNRLHPDFTRQGILLLKGRNQLLVSFEGEVELIFASKLNTFTFHENFATLGFICGGAVGIGGRDEGLVIF